MKTKFTYRIIPTAHPERKKALAFIETWGRKWHKCSPPKTRGDIIACFQGNEVVGTATLDFSNKKRAFPLEKIYNFEYVKTYFPFFERETVVQGGRWFAKKENISHMLLHAIAEYCLPRKIEYLIAEVKETSIKRLEELGVKFVILYGVPPDLSVIPEEGLNYYNTPPPPRLILMRLSFLYMEGTSLL